MTEWRADGRTDIMAYRRTKGEQTDRRNGEKTGGRNGEQTDGQTKTVLNEGIINYKIPFKSSFSIIFISNETTLFTQKCSRIKCPYPKRGCRHLHTISVYPIFAIVTFKNVIFALFGAFNAWKFGHDSSANKFSRFGPFFYILQEHFCMLCLTRQSRHY